HAKASVNGGADSVEGKLVSAFTAHGKIVVLLLSIHVHREAQIFAGFEQVQLFFQQQRVGAEIDIFLAREQAVDNFIDLRMHQRLAAGNRDHRRSTLINRFEAIFQGEIGFQDVGRVLDLAAAGAGQVAAEQRLEHEHKRVAGTAQQALLENVRRHRPHLGDRHWHRMKIAKANSLSLLPSRLRYCQWRLKEAGRMLKIQKTMAAGAAGGSAAAAVRRTPLQERSADTVEQILAAASGLLGRMPAGELTTSLIASEAGISVGGLYRFFPDKQSIIDALAV